MKVKEFAHGHEITASEAWKLDARGGKFADGHAHRFRDTFAGWRASGAGFYSTRSQQHQSYRETLRAMGARTTGAG